MCDIPILSDIKFYEWLTFIFVYYILWQSYIFLTVVWLLLKAVRSLLMWWSVSCQLCGCCQRSLLMWWRVSCQLCVCCQLLQVNYYAVWETIIVVYCTGQVVQLINVKKKDCRASCFFSYEVLYHTVWKYAKSFKAPFKNMQ